MSDYNSYGVLFDVDGVLTDSAEPHWQSWKQLAEEIGKPMTREQFDASFGRQNRDIIPEVFDIHDPIEIENCGKRKEDIYRDVIRNHVPPVEGAVELVRQCRDAGFRLAVGSSGPKENIQLVLEGLGIRDCFSAMVTARDVTKGKPDPEVFQLAAEKVGLPSSRCCVIEDAPAGVSAAIAAGSVAIGLSGLHSETSLSHGTQVVRSLHDVSPEMIFELITG